MVDTPCLDFRLIDRLVSADISDPMGQSILRIILSEIVIMNDNQPVVSVLASGKSARHFISHSVGAY